MTTHIALICSGREGAGGITPGQTPNADPGRDEVAVAVAAAAVNPIDVMRAQGYGHRLLSLMGAARFPMVLGNDLAGTVTAVGSQVTGLRPGQRVYGAKGASRAGSHAAQVIVKAGCLRPVPEGADLTALAALPYSFTTMWLAVRGAGLSRETAQGRKVLVHGAAGGLGTLAVQMLTDWGAKVTGIARTPDLETCRSAGAIEAYDGAENPFPRLSGRFDATLNFAAWDDDAALLGCLHEGALGHATTVHPMLRNFDDLGFLRGALRTAKDKRQKRAALPRGVRSYAWTLFRPKAEALAELDRLVRAGRVGLPIGLRVPLAEGAKAFDHVRSGRPGRALILP